MPPPGPSDFVLPELPTDTCAYRRARREELCASLSASAYTEEPLKKDGFIRFTSPEGTCGPKATLAAIAYVEDGTGYLSFRGTVPAIPRNLLSDLDAFPTGDPHRHRGFDRCWRRLQPGIERWLASQSVNQLVLTGHSLGGSIAQIAAMELAGRWPIEGVVCFGAPLVGGQPFAAAYDATSIAQRSACTLGAVTTTFVFKSDLFRTVTVLPALGFKPNGEQIVIDEHGRPSQSFLPWYADALHKGISPLVWFNSVWGAINAAPSQNNPVPVQLLSRPNSVDPSSRMLLDFNDDGHVDRNDLTVAAQWFARNIGPVIRYLPWVMEGLLILIALLAASGAFLATVFAYLFVKRDFHYHSVSENYVQAMRERVERWNPLIYEERGNDLLANKDPVAALPYLEAAFAESEREARSLALTGQDVLQWTRKSRLSWTATLIETGNYAKAIALLGPLADQQYPSPIDVPVSASGAFVLPGRLLALQQRARALEGNRQFPEAIKDYAEVIGARASVGFDEFPLLIRAAERKAGVTGRLRRTANIFFSFKQEEVDRELSSIHSAALLPAQSTLKKLAAWAHYHSASCAYSIDDLPTVILQATAAFELDQQDAWACHLRGLAQWRLKHQEAALADLTLAIDLHPEVAGFWYARAIARLAPEGKVKVDRAEDNMLFFNLARPLNDCKLSEADLIKAVELDPSHPDARMWLDGLQHAMAQNTLL